MFARWRHCAQRFTDITLLGVALVFLLFLAQSLNLEFRSWEYIFADGTSMERTSPEKVGAPAGLFWMQGVISLSKVHPFMYHIAPDDCLDRLWVNGVAINGGIPFCDYRSGIEKLITAFHAGENTINAVIHNNGGPAGFAMYLSPMDPIQISIALVFVGLCALYCLMRALQRGMRKRWILVEYGFLGGFLGSRVWVLFRSWNYVQGFDAWPHFDEIVGRPWLSISDGIRDRFLSYHPPLGFLLQKAVHALGFSPAVSAQLTSWAAALLTFFLLRLILKRLSVLHTPIGIAFLYLASSIPLQIFLSTSAGLDIFILTTTAATLCISIFLWWSPMVSGWRRMLLLAALSITLAIALLTKFNGVILISIPIFVALMANEKKIRSASSAFVLVCIALALVSPYYLLRNYAQEGTLFPNNVHWLQEGHHAEAIKARDADTWKFFRHLLSPSLDGFFPRMDRAWEFRHHDVSSPRLADTWKGFWIANRNPLWQSRPSILMSVRYLQAAVYLVMIGFFVFIWRIFRSISEQWTRLGVILFAYSSLSLVALISYVYNGPYAGYYPTKSVYVASLIWMIAYVIIEACRFLSVPFRKWVPLQRIATVIAFILLGLFVFINHMLPVY